MLLIPEKRNQNDDADIPMSYTSQPHFFNSLLQPRNYQKTLPTHKRQQETYSGLGEPQATNRDFWRRGTCYLTYYNCIMKFSKAPEPSFFTSWYVIVNLLLIVAYPLLRIFTVVGRRDLRHLDAFGFTFENSIIYTGLGFVAVYYIRCSSLREFLMDCLSIGRIVVACLLIYARFQLSIYYAILCLISWLLIPYPRYNAPNKFIRIQSVQQFDELVGPAQEDSEDQSKPTQGYCYKDKNMFFVQFYVDWLYPCNVSKELWYEYSYRYTTPSFRFLQVNASRLPELAKRYHINISGFTKQLPSIVIIENGQETARFPPIKQNNKVDRVVKLDYKILLKYFDLESRYLQTRQPTIPNKK